MSGDVQPVITADKVTFILQQHQHGDGEEGQRSAVMGASVCE